MAYDFESFDFTATRGKPRPGQPRDESGDVTRGFKTAFQQLPQLGYGLMAGAGAAAENVFGEDGIASGIKSAGVEGFQRWGEKIAAGSKESDSLSYSWDQAKEGNFGALVDWFQYGLGYAGGQAVQTLATAGIGSLVGKATLQTVAKDLAKGMVLKETAAIKGTEAGAKLAADEVIALATKSVASRLGQSVGLGASAFGMEGGEIFGDLVSTAEKEGRQLSGDELAKAFGATLAAGGLEFVGDKFGLDVMLGKSKVGNSIMSLAGQSKGIGGRVARGALGAAVAVPAEGATEYFQTGLEEYGKGKETEVLPWLQSEEAQKQAFDAAGLGAVGGFAMGGAGGLMSRANERQKKADEAVSDLTNATTADEAVDAAQRSVDVPITPQGISGFAESRALDALDAQAAGDAAATKYGTEPRPGKQWSLPQETALGDAMPFGDRVLSLREQLSDADVRETLRSALGPDALETVSYYVSIADRTDIDMPEKTRERLLSLAEGIVDRALFKREGGQGQEVAGLRAEPQRRIGLDTAQTGVMRVDSDGNAAPETRADAINTRQSTLRDRVDGMVAQRERGAQPVRKAPETPRAQRTQSVEAVDIDPAAPNAVAQYVERMRGVNTLAARAFVRDFEAGRITPQDVIDRLIPRSEQTADERLAAAAAQAPKSDDGLLLTSDGFPYGTKSGATIRARREGLDAESVIEVPGGYAVRTKETSSVEPELPSAAAGVSGSGADGTGVAGASAGTVRPVADDASRRVDIPADAADGVSSSDLQRGGQRDGGDDSVAALKVRWQQAVIRGDMDAATAINGRIVEIKRRGVDQAATLPLDVGEPAATTEGAAHGAGPAESARAADQAGTTAAGSAGVQTMPSPAADLAERVEKTRHAPTQDASTTVQTAPSRALIELRKREAVLNKLLACMGGKA